MTGHTGLRAEAEAARALRGSYNREPFDEQDADDPAAMSRAEQELAVRALMAEGKGLHEIARELSLHWARVHGMMFEIRREARR